MPDEKMENEINELYDYFISKSDEEIEKGINELYDYFINLGVDFDTLLKFNSLCIERAIRSVNNERV